MPNLEDAVLPGDLRYPEHHLRQTEAERRKTFEELALDYDAGMPTEEEQ